MSEQKLSEQYRKEAAFAEEQSRKAFEDKNETLGNHLAGGASAFRHVAEDVEKLEAEKERLRKRVAELEERNAELEAAYTECEELAKQRSIPIPVGLGEVCVSECHDQRTRQKVNHQCQHAPPSNPSSKRKTSAAASSGHWLS